MKNINIVRLRVHLMNLCKGDIPVPARYLTETGEMYTEEVKRKVVDEVCLGVKTLEDEGIDWKICVACPAFATGAKSLRTLISDVGIFTSHFCREFQKACKTTTIPGGVFIRENQEALLRRGVWVSALAVVYSLSLDEERKRNGPLLPAPRSPLCGSGKRKGEVN
ncbi:MAG: hypothetical protein Q8P52_03320 [bacterium]|nr:hypothetical protein [bacterium]